MVNRSQRVFKNDLYNVYTAEEVADILGLKASVVREIASRLGIGRIEGTYRFTKAQISSLKSYFNGNTVT